MAGNQLIFCKEVLIPICLCLIWNIEHWHAMGDHNLIPGIKNVSKAGYLPTVLLKTLFHSIHFKLLFLILCPNILESYIKVSLFLERLQV